MRDLQNRRVLITGAARGIGRGLAAAFLEQGAQVVLTDVHREVLREAAERLGPRCEPWPLDVTDVSAVRELHDRLRRQERPVDVLINNAGLVFGGPFLDVELERHERTYAVNVLGTVNMTHVFLPMLIARPAAHLVNVASASGYLGLPYGASYASSKWAAIGFSDSIRQELALTGKHHVRVTTVCPGYVDTGLFEGVRSPLLMRMLTVDRLARAVVRAVRRDRPYLLTPWLVKLAPPLVAALPVWLSDRIARLLGVTRSMVPWRGRGQA